MTKIERRAKKIARRLDVYDKLNVVVLRDKQFKEVLKIPTAIAVFVEDYAQKIPPTIFLNKMYFRNIRFEMFAQVIKHELCHYITGASDGSQEFNEFCRLHNVPLSFLVYKGRVVAGVYQ